MAHGGIAQDARNASVEALLFLLLPMICWKMTNTAMSNLDVAKARLEDLRSALDIRSLAGIYCRSVIKILLLTT